MRMVYYLIALYLLVSNGNAEISQLGRNIEGEVKAIQLPEKPGDVLEVEWWFELKPENDPIEDILKWRKMTIRTEVVLQISTYKENLICDTLWFDNIDYNTRISNFATHNIPVSGRILCGLTIKTYEVREDGLFECLKNYIDGFGFNIESGGSTVDEMVYYDSVTHITIKTGKPPEELYKIDTSGKYDFRPNKWTPNEMKQFRISETPGDTVFEVFTDSVYIVGLNQIKSSEMTFLEIKGVQILEYNNRILRIKILKEEGDSFIIVQTDDAIFRIDFKQIWMIDGIFQFENQVSGQTEPIQSVECFFFEKVNDQFVQTNVGWLGPDGYFYFYSRVEEVRVMILSSHEQAFVFYASDSCFDFSIGEQHYYHGCLLDVSNPYHTNFTVPLVNTTITDFGVSSVFHVLNVVKYASNSFGYPTISWRVPIYFLNSDNCANGSNFGGFEIAGVPGIQIEGKFAQNDCDQWDSTVIFHELGHFFQYDTSGFSLSQYDTIHTFVLPTSNYPVQTSWTEGFASFFACRLLGHSNFTNIRFPLSDTAYSFDFELPSPDVPYYLSYYQTSPSSLNPFYAGCHVEGSVCIALWDIYDLNDDADYYKSGNIYGHNNDSNSSEYWASWDPILDVMVNFDPQPENPDHDYCWNIYEFIHGWRKLGYPIDSTFINILEAHNVRYFLPGDFDHDEYVNMIDILYFIQWDFDGTGIPPVPCALADVNADCKINILDILYLIDYKFSEGPEPLAGCFSEPLWPQNCR